MYRPKHNETLGQVPLLNTQRSSTSTASYTINTSKLPFSLSAMHCNQHLLSVSLLFATASALEINLYGNGQCTGRVAVTSEAKPADGCQTALLSNYGGIINNWSGDDDNNYMFVSYSDDNCCHNNMVEQISWDDGVCQKVQQARSYRIVNVDEPDKGKDGQIYSCGGEGEQ